MGNSAQESNHGQSAVYNFRLLAIFDLFWGHALQHTAVESIIARLALAVVLVKGRQLNEGHEQKDLQVGGESDAAGSTENVSVRELFAWEVDARLLHQNAHNRQHSDATILQLSPTSVLQISLNVRPMNDKHRSEMHENEQYSLPTAPAIRESTYRRMGSNPMSPGIEPSSLSGLTKKGMDLDISSAFKATELTRGA